MIDFLAVFITFFAVIDPIGTVPVFLAITRNYDEHKKRQIAFIAILVSGSILLFFIVAGEYLLQAMGVSLPAFQIAGGIVLFLFALSMIFGESKPEEEIQMIDRHHETAIFPLAVPSIAGPGAMLAVVLLTEKTKFNLLEQVQTAAMMVCVLAVTYILMLGSNWINKIIGKSGASVISRVMGLILASVATTNALNGIRLYFSL